VLLSHEGASPHVEATAYVAPTAVVCGDVTVGAHCRVLFGAVLVAEGGPVTLGEYSIVMENAVLRGSARHPLRLGRHVLVGPHAHLSGCIVEDNVFIATGASVFNGARLGTRSAVRINGVVHVNTVLPPDVFVPIGWIAVGDPAEILSPDRHDRIWEIQRTLNFPHTVFGLEPAAPGETIMPEMTRRYTRALGRHRDDRPHA
jgi:carbonic anhydrase/acetyltransferase-like protein (isoleucine patch superfamily)